MTEPPTQDQLDAYVRTRLALAGSDLSLLPEQAFRTLVLLLPSVHIHC